MMDALVALIFGAGVKPALKMQALELLLQACDEAGKVALALTDKHVGSGGRSEAAIPATTSKIATQCSVLSRLQDLHVLLEGSGVAACASSAPKRPPSDGDSTRPPLHPADAGRSALPLASAASSTVNSAAAAVPCLRVVAAALSQPLQSSRSTCSDFLRHCTHILKDLPAPVPPVTSSPSISALRLELRRSLGLERPGACDAPAAAEVEGAVKEGSDSIALAVTAIDEAAVVFPW